MLRFMKYNMFVLEAEVLQNKNKPKIYSVDLLIWGIIFI